MLKQLINNQIAKKPKIFLRFFIYPECHTERRFVACRRIYFLKKGTFVRIIRTKKASVREMKESEEEEIVVISPTQMVYKDRGMKKWMGLILSEHTDAMRQDDKERAERESKKIGLKESEEVIGEKLLLSMANKQIVSVQQDIMRNGVYIQPLTGSVEGFYEQQVVFQTNEGRKGIEMSTIRSVDYVPFQKWTK